MSVNSMEELFGPVISRYTRAQAIEDGNLIDVTETAREAAIVIPVAVTSKLWHEYVVPDPRAEQFGQSTRGRLWDLLWVFRYVASRNRQPRSELRFKVRFIMKARQKRDILVKAIVSGGDDGQPVLTIMLPDED